MSVWLGREDKSQAESPSEQETHLLSHKQSFFLDKAILQEQRSFH